MGTIRLHTSVVSVVALLAVVGAGGGSGSAAAGTSAPPELQTPSLVRLGGPVASAATSTLDAAGLPRLESLRWHGGRYATASGSVSVSVSAAYAADSGAAARWADFFASLVHGPELALLQAYIAPLDEVQVICGGNGEVLGCYGVDRLVSVGDSSGGIAPESVAAHEYGHHVANNRLNPPWVAVDWGTKRWATDVNVCRRAAIGTAFPGAEDANYSLNPGEGFAESYRVLNDTATGAAPAWQIVDNSFRPDAAALQAIRDDVLQPWTAPTTRTIRGRFGRGRTAWRLPLATPLDGSLSVRLSSGSYDLQLLDAGMRGVLSQGSWTESGGRSLDYPICGRRSFVVRVSRAGPARTFTLRISTP